MLLVSAQLALLHASHAAPQVPAAAGSSSVRPDAAVNAANVMCSLAELCEGQEVLGLLNQAVQLYQSALTQEEDTAVSTCRQRALLEQL